MPNDSSPTPGPPRLLLGVSLLFWGAITGHAFIALLAAFACEARHWVRIRWNFTDETFYRAWQVSIILLIITWVLVWMNSSFLSALPRTLVWLPLILFPLQFVQAYGMNRTMPLATFSIFVRKRLEHARRHDLPFRDVRAAFGHVYFASILIASGVNRPSAATAFFVGVIVLLAWAFHRRLFQARRVPVAALLMLALASAGALGGERVFDYVYRRIVLEGRVVDPLDYARQTSTSIGDLDGLKQSPEIVWRLKRITGSLPRLLRIASYSAYKNTNWHAPLPPISDEEKAAIIAAALAAGTEPVLLNRTSASDFIEPDIGNEFRPGEFYRVTGRLGPNADDFLPANEASSEDLPRFLLRGPFAEKALFPLPGNTASLHLPNQLIEINSYGTLRVDPKHPVANALIVMRDDTSTGMPPWEDTDNPRNPRPDLSIPDSELEAIRSIARELDLYDGNLATKINTLRLFFVKNFTYSRYGKEPTPRDRDTFLSQFLTRTRRGHCEYFATATALLLREAGIPTRYATGYAVVETQGGGDEVLVRGVHGHAWCLAWDETRHTWIDVDLTPPDWTGLETPPLPPWQGLLDRWQMLRDDLLVWRSEPGNFALALTVLFVPLALGGAFIARRLWKSRLRLDPLAVRRQVRPQQANSPLHALEKPASGFLGERPPGRPLGHWLADLTPFLRDKDALAQAIELHRSLRFDPAADPESLRPELTGLVQDVRRDLEARPVLASGRPSYP